MESSVKWIRACVMTFSTAADQWLMTLCLLLALHSSWWIAAFAGFMAVLEKAVTLHFIHKVREQTGE